jgi:hypothetical protein
MSSESSVLIENSSRATRGVVVPATERPATEPCTEPCTEPGVDEPSRSGVRPAVGVAA